MADAGRVSLQGWTPVRARPSARELVVEWRWLDDAPFRAPFFAETVQSALARPFSLLFPRLTTLDELAELEPGLEPSGFVLHMSRCGSTLVTQMLAAVPEFLVLSEPQLVNDVLRPAASDEERARRLRLAVAALGQRRTGDERGYVLKLDPWATADLTVIRGAFPETPWLFLARDPAEVLVSHRRQAGMQMMPTVVPPELFDVDPMSAATMSFEEYGARGLGAICRQALANRDEHALFFDYKELPDAVDRVLERFGLEVTGAERAAMEVVIRRDAKNPSRAYTPDAHAKADAATPQLRAAVDEWARPAYDALRGS